jgi:hypothetical protein
VPDLLTDMAKAERLVRQKPVRRELVCPVCGSDRPCSGEPKVKFYACPCGAEFEALAELRVVETT